MKHFFAIIVCVASALVAPAQERAPKGKFISIAREHCVRNTTGCCGWAAIETIARHQGIEELHGVSRGKGASSSATIGSFLKGRGLPFKQSDSGLANGWKLIHEMLAEDCPVLVNVPNHAFVLCGLTTDAGGNELVWIIDNTGNERQEPRGWPKREFDAEFGGWVCGIFRSRCQPQSRPSVPHVLPNPENVPQKPKPSDDPKPFPGPTNTELADKLDKALQAIEALAKIKVQPGPQGPAGKDSIVPGPAGPAGPAGKDADSAALQKEITALRGELKAMRDYRFTAELLDEAGNPVQPPIRFGFGLPLKIQTLPVK